MSQAGNQFYDAPPLLRDFLVYHRAIQGHSKATVEEYYLDLRSFFRFLKKYRDPALDNLPMDKLEIDDIDLAFISSVVLTDVYAYMNYLTTERALNGASRARKIAAIRSFYKYLTNKAKLLSVNPVQDLDSPRQMKSLPKYLNLEESVDLLQAIDGQNSVRDYCILTLFLNCGLRISELVGLNVADIHGEQLRVLGKGNKQRLLFLNDACLSALSEWLDERNTLVPPTCKPLFVTKQRRDRISTAAVHKLVKKHIGAAGLDQSQYSSHKLRHTAATLMLQNGVDVRTLQEVLGHDHLNTTQIYTHVDNEGLRLAAKANPLANVAKPKKFKKEN